MNIGEMHVWFRQYAQQMGMQNVRAILPEQIDLLINTSISDTINQLIRENIGVTNDRVITDNSKIGQINALQTLYKVLEVSMVVNTAPGSTSIFHKGSEIFIERYYANISEMKDSKADALDYLFLVDLSINYSKIVGSGEIPSITNWYPVRLIDDAFLADTLNDFILKPKFRSPISVIYNGQLDVYVDENAGLYKDSKLKPNKLRIAYISKPNKVLYAEDVKDANGNSLSRDCDLPESMHVDILKHAVDLYRISVSGALSSSQQQQQAQQQEDARNNYRNEGTQQR